MVHTPADETLPTLSNAPVVPASDVKTPISEKANPSDDGKLSPVADKEADAGFETDESNIVHDGKDVSRLVVDLRDDGDPALTFRSIVLGTVLAGLGATLVQIYQFKPLQMTVSTTFLLLISWSMGQAWAYLLPRRAWVEGTRFEKFAGVLDFINPGEFQIKEHVVASLIASTAAYGSTAVLNFSVQRLYYNTNVGALTAVLATFSTACFGYGLVGLLRPLTVYPAEMVYWTGLPNVAVFQALHYDTAANAKRLKLFWTSFAGMFVWEIIPSYMFPLLNGISIFCLASQKASTKTRDVFTNLFGGAGANEGLGLLSIGLDWQYIGSNYMSYPLLQQANSWIGIGLCYIIVMAIYYSNAWNSLEFPMLSTSLFNSNGTVYKQIAVFQSPSFSVNETALDIYGLPALTGSNAWNNLTANLAIGALIAHCFLFWSGFTVDSFKAGWNRTQNDPHYQAMLKYKEAPMWWYMVLLVLSFLAGLIVVLKGDTTLPVWGYIVALISGAIITPFSTLLYARLGNGIATNQLFKMIAGAIHPGKPVANLYFYMWSHDVVSTSINLESDLKIGQYLKIPPRVMFLTQVWGTVLGAIINYVVMISVVESRREILLDPKGNNVWSGQSVQSLNSSGITWALAKYLYSPHGPYAIIPAAIGIGVIPTFIQWLISKKWKKIGPIRVDQIMLPVIWMYSHWNTTGVTSYVTTSIIIGIVSQVWLRRYHPRWFKKYNYILAGGLDGGAQVMIFVLSFAVFGASGKERPFPNWAGNPAVGNVDYCNGNGALDE